MANGVNKVTLIGNLGRDPEVRYTQSGTAVCNITVAIGERRKDGDEWKEHTEWVNCVCFGKTAENVGQYLSKGRQVYVDGRMQTRKYQDKNGQDRWTTEVVANQVLFLGNKGSSDNSSRGDFGGGNNNNFSSNNQNNFSGGNSGGGNGPDLYDDDLPF